MARFPRMASMALHYKSEVVVENPKLTPNKTARRHSNAALEKQYLDLQKLRVEVRRAEMSSGARMRDEPCAGGHAGVESAVERVRVGDRT